MFLTDKEIRIWAEGGGIRPYVPDHVNPASIDLTLGSEWRDLDKQDEIQYPNYGKITIKSPKDVNNFGGIDLWAGFPTAILAVTEEWIEIPDNMVGMIKLKSTPTRMGLGHPIADWVDPGYKGKLTLMLNAVKKITLPVGIRIVQLVLCKLDRSVEMSYEKTGHYMYQNTPTVARSDYVE